MATSASAAEAASVLSKQRWKSHVADRLAVELIARADQLGSEQREALRVALADDETTEEH